MNNSLKVYATKARALKRRNCVEKKRFCDHWTATAHAREQKQYPYLCAVCGYWHVSSKR